MLVFYSFYSGRACFRNSNDSACSDWPPGVLLFFEHLSAISWCTNKIILSNPGFKLYNCEEEGRNMLFIMGGLPVFCDHKNDFCHTKCVGCSRRERRLGQKTARIIQFSVLNKKVAIHAMLMVFFSIQQNLENIKLHQKLGEQNSRVFLLRQIWIVNYYVKNLVENSQ